MSVDLWGPWMRDNRYGGKRKLALLAIADAVGPDGVGFISQKQIMSWAGVSEDYARLCVKGFVDDGVLAVVAKGTGPGRATTYRLNPPSEKGGSGAAGKGGFPPSLTANPPSLAPVPPPLPPSIPAQRILGDALVAEATRQAFDYWYSIYPKKENKKAAEKKYLAAVKQGATPSQLLDGLEKQIAYWKKNETERRYMKAPDVWLNQGCWMNEYEGEAKARPSLVSPERLAQLGYTRQPDGDWLNESTMNRVKKENVS